MDKRINSIIIGVLILLAIAFILGYQFGKSKSKIIEKDKIVEVIKNDTVVIEKIKPKKFYYYKTDTLKLTELITDTIIIPSIPFVAEIDTTFRDNLYLNVKYISPPINSFDIKYKLPDCNLIRPESKFKISYGIGIFLGTKGIDGGVYLGLNLK